MNDQTGGEASVALSLVEQASVDVVSLKAPANDMKDTIIETAAEPAGEGGIGTEAVSAGVPDSEESLGKGTYFPD